jgi:hypothetical protein
MVHDGSSHSPLVTPPACPRHALKDALMVCLELAESVPVLDFEPKQVNAGTRVFFGVVSALAVRLDLALTPFLSESCESGFEQSTAGVVVHECGVDAEGVTAPERFEVGFKGVTDEDGGGPGVGCKDGEEVGLDLGEGRRGHGERCLGDA